MTSTTTVTWDQQIEPNVMCLCVCVPVTKHEHEMNKYPILCMYIIACDYLNPLIAHPTNQKPNQTLLSVERECRQRWTGTRAQRR